jgi:hypothetical protein
MAKKNSPSKEHLDFLKEVLATNGIDLQVEISLCLSDIPKERMSKAKNGKIYVDVVAAMRKEPDQWNRDVKVYARPTEADRKNQAPKIYVGGGRLITFAKSSGETPSDEEVNNLMPFEPPHETNPF